MGCILGARFVWRGLRFSARVCLDLGLGFAPEILVRYVFSCTEQFMSSSFHLKFEYETHRSQYLVFLCKNTVHLPREVHDHVLFTPPSDRQTCGMHNQRCLWVCLPNCSMIALPIEKLVHRLCRLSSFQGDSAVEEDSFGEASLASRHHSLFLNNSASCLLARGRTTLKLLQEAVAVAACCLKGGI